MPRTHLPPTRPQPDSPTARPRRASAGTLARAGLAALALACGPLLGETAPASPAQPAAPAEPAIAVAGAQINVQDVEAAVAFYTGALGFELLARHADSASLKAGATEITLLRASEAAKRSEQNGAETRVNLRTSDLAATTAGLKARGIKFTTDEPEMSAVGPYMVFADPSGNLFDLIERPPSPSAPDGVRVFNIGIAVPKMAEARKFYIEQLGFEVFSEDYYPPDLPLHKRGQVALVLHESGGEPTAVGFPTVPQTLVVFTTPDLERSLAGLRAKGAEVQGPPRTSPLGNFAVLRDPFGNLHLLREVAPPPGAP